MIGMGVHTALCLIWNIRKCVGPQVAIGGWKAGITESMVWAIQQ